jgi:PAS domain S-box
MEQRVLINKRYHDEAVAFSKTLSSSAAIWLASYDIAGLQELVDAQKDYPGLSYVILTDTEGRILAHTDQTKIGQFVLDMPKLNQLTLISETPTMIDIAIPAKLSSKQVGWVRVGIGNQLLIKKLSEIELKGVFYAIIAILFSIFLAWHLGHRMTQRLYVIQNTISSIRKGNRAARSKLDGKDEAAILAKEFNAMLDTLDQRESELKNSESRFKKLFDDAAVPLCLISNEGTMLNFNRHFVRTFGYSEEDLSTIQDWWQLAYPDPEYRTKIIESWEIQKQKTGGSITIIEPKEYEVTSKDGRKIIVEISGTPFGNGFLTNFFDVTARKEVEQELTKAKEKAEESDKLKSAFLANMSHEIRTPMNSILGFTEILKDPDVSEEERQEYLQIIETSGARMLNIISDIVDVSKIESGQMRISISEVNISKKLKDMHSFFKPEAEKKGLSLSIDCDLNNDLVIKTDREKIYGILSNLIKNAIKYTKTGTIKFGYKDISTELQKTQNQANQSILLFYVSDTGMGISPDQKNIIFERFRQGSESMSRKHEGAGLGLSISKAYIEMLGGKIWFESQEKKGSIFYFTLPCVFVS